jgi:hypothetical protein
MPSESNFLQELHKLAARHGVFPDDADLEAVQGFLEAILPQLAELERRLPPGTEAE